MNDFLHQLSTLFVTALYLFIVALTLGAFIGVVIRAARIVGGV
jgi:hypothetical protein